MNIAFFHGLDSLPVSEKTEFLHKNFESVYAPPMDYRKENLFEEVLQEVKNRKIDLLVGSSMGGWFAYCISTLTGIPTLLFNPAVHSRSIEVKTRVGDIPADHTVVLGMKDTVVNPSKTCNWVDDQDVGVFHLKFHMEMEHRIPLEIFEKYIHKNIRKVETH